MTAAATCGGSTRPATFSTGISTWTSTAKEPDIQCQFIILARKYEPTLDFLSKLLNDEVKSRSRKNVVEARSFLEMLEKTIKLYQNPSIETAEMIAKLIELAREMREAHKRGENLGLTDDELAFYDALEVNDSAVKVLGDETLRTIARELVESVRNNVTWETVQRLRGVKPRKASRGQALFPVYGKASRGQALRLRGVRGFAGSSPVSGLRYGLRGPGRPGPRSH
jgi:hypothetical protein